MPFSVSLYLCIADLTVSSPPLLLSVCVCPLFVLVGFDTFGCEKRGRLYHMGLISFLGEHIH